MVFPSSIPLYLDPPNWHQHSNQQLQATNNHNEHQHQHQLIPPPQQQAHQLGIGGPGSGSGPQQGRPTSMSEQARQMKIPPPMVPLKCPRCESSNTKFCYYNNYNLSQPRHFCKGCRRYWTQSGALRNVPIGGGCRKNKRSSSKSTSSSSGGTPKPSIIGRMDRLGSHSGLPSGGGGNNSLSFMASTLQNMIHSGAVSNMGHTFSGGPMHNTANSPGIGGLEFPHLNPRQLHFPNFLGGFEMPGSSTGGGLFSSSYQNVEDNNINNEDGNDQEQQMNEDMSKSLGSRMIPSSQVKMEDNNGQRRLNLANQMLIMGISPTANNNDDNKNNTSNNNQYNWGNNVTNSNNNAEVVSSMWMNDLSNTSHLL